MKTKKRPMVILFVLVLFFVFYGFLSLPMDEEPGNDLPGETPFVWDSDTRWAALEQRFSDVRASGCSGLLSEASERLDRLEADIDEVANRTSESEDPVWQRIEDQVFGLAPIAAACSSVSARYLRAVRRSRSSIKRASAHWDVNAVATERRLYRTLYGARLAEEELLLQRGELEREALVSYSEVLSLTPFALVHGVRIHSGDLLVSRGGAPTSALIARGNDYPGNFSHVGLVHVDPDTREPVVVEAHIERGVAVASAQEYLADTKMRVLIMRMREDHPLIVKDPLLPHRAASAALERARSEHVPYDFAMDFDDPKALFCSEVASWAYRRVGVRLWMGISTMSSPGLTRWLFQLGVRNFRTQAPSDLEYDPQLSLVAEWRDPQTLFKDHVDNAVIDAFLELADAGQELEYNRWLLPVARLFKSWSIFLNWFGGVGPVPEGMTAVSALRSEWFSAWHARVFAKTITAAEDFQRTHGYRPPYWQLVNLARASVSGDS